MPNEIPGVTNTRAYRSRMDRLCALTGVEYLNELFSYDPNSPDNPKPHGKQNSNRKSAWKKEHRRAKLSRRRNRGSNLR